MNKEEIKKRETKLLELTGTICAQKLNDEYFQPPFWQELMRRKVVA